MNRLTFAALGGSLALAAACSSGSDERAPAIGAGGGPNARAGDAGAPSLGDAGSGSPESGGKPNALCTACQSSRQTARSRTVDDGRVAKKSATSGE